MGIWGTSAVTLAVSVVALTLAPSAQFRDTGDLVSLPASRTIELHSTVNGGDYRLLVLLPADYGTPKGEATRYPVLYMGDGNITAPLAFTLYRTMKAGYAARVQDVILVGVGYPTGLQARRAEDSTPTSVGPITISPRTGGASGFLRVLREEVIPFIERTYRVTDERSYIGASFTGLFGAFGLLEDPALFKNWVLGSPTLAWDDNWIFRREAEYARTHKDLPAHLYIWSGEQDGNTAAALRLAELLRSRKYPNLAVTTETIVDGTHDSIWPDSLFRALRAIYLDSKTQEVRTYIDVVVPNASLNAVADQVKACLLADHIPIADSSTDSLVMSDPIVSNPAARFPYTQVYRVVMTQTAKGDVSVRLSGTGQSGTASATPLTSEYFAPNSNPISVGWAVLERLALRLRGGSR